MVFVSTVKELKTVLLPDASRSVCTLAIPIPVSLHVDAEQSDVLLTIIRRRSIGRNFVPHHVLHVTRFTMDVDGALAGGFTRRY